MTDSMKFGPEWLRNLSGDSCNSGGSGGGTANLITPRYQLAEHRYGREEMLALFDRTYKPPESLMSLQTLYVEKSQLPLAFIPETEDETRVRNSGISNTGGRGRGGSVDRGGRLRGGRGGMYSSHFSRGFDDLGDGGRLDSQPYSGRNRAFDRSQSERGWSERNGISDTNDWNGSTSPRKELNRGPSSSSLMEVNWRRHRGAGDDEEGWRAIPNSRGERWVRGNWRDGGGSSHHHHSTRTRNWDTVRHDNHDNLPEWATENPSESGGSFDATGAFHGDMPSDDDEDGVHVSRSHENRTRRISEGANSSNPKAGSKSMSYSNNSMNQMSNRQINLTTNAVTRERPKSLHPFEDKDASIESEKRSVSPTKQPVALSNNPLKTTTSLTNPPIKKDTNPVNPVKTVEPNKIQPPQRSKSFVELPSKRTAPSDSRPQQDSGVLAARHKPQIVQSNIETHPNNDKKNNVSKPDDDLERMKEEADMLVAKLMADEESHREEVPPVMMTVPNHVQPSPIASAQSQEKWFYRDPQGEVQGPFLASEMAEWCKAGYFTQGLLVRRTCDERYATLGDLTKLCGRVPFIPGPPIPPLKLAEPSIPAIPNAVPAGIPSSALPKPGIDDPMLLLQYQQLRMMHNQQLLLRQMKTSALAKLSQSEHWATLSPVEQNQLLMQCVMQDSELRDIPMAANLFAGPLAPNMQPATNPIMQLFSQMQQTKTQSDNHLPTNAHPAAGPVHPVASGLDPIQQLIQQMGGIQNLPGPPQPTLNPPTTQPPPPQEEDAIKSLLRQLHVNANGHPTQSHPIDSIWPQPPPQINTPFNAQNWLAQVGPLPPMPPGQMPSSLWDLYTKEMKTEQQILEEQNIRIQEDRKKDELRKKEELIRQAEDESAKRKLEEETTRQMQEANRKEEEKKRKEEEKKLREEEKRKQEEEIKRKEEKKRKDEEKKREEKRKQDEENNRKKQEEEKRKRDETKKLEEKMKKEEEKRKKIEEEQKRIEEERVRKEEEARKKNEAEEQARKAEQRRREAEALKKLQERSKAPWAQAPLVPPPTTHASLAEIQRLEREKKAEEQRFQQMVQQQMAQQKAMEAAKEVATVESSKRLQFKWAGRAAPANKLPQVKSLAQIQQEEQERIAKVKQQEKERQEKTNKSEVAVTMQNAGIWGTASQSLNWAATTNSSNDTMKIGNKSWTGSGFWDEPVPSKPAVASKPLTKTTSIVTKPTIPSHQQQQHQNNNNKTPKNKSKKEEELVKKLFENNTAKPDDFTQWCNRTLSGLQVSVDIPTFVGFLRDIESAYEVKEYVRLYLGDSKQCIEFAKQFLEKRSKWRSAQRPQAEADDLCKPAPAVNPNAPTEFQEVKGKSKKPKKGKMFKVDSRILGFSVTAATDRINVGDRDYGEGV